MSEKKYVPPHMRNKESTAAVPKTASVDLPPDVDNRGGRSFGGGGDRRGGSGGYNNGGGGGYDNRGYNSRGGGGGYQNNRREFPGGDRRGYGGDRRGGGAFGNNNNNNRGGGGGGYYNNGPRKNELGFHGSLKKDTRTEQQLFGTVKLAGINFDKYDDIPVEASGMDIPEGISTFEEANIHISLRENLKRSGFERPTPVQKYSTPIGMAGRDLMACAQTGSGKTGGFLFPTISAMLEKGPVVEEDDGRRSRGKVFPNALILAPTRELAVQIYDEALKFTYCTGIAPVCIYGGADVRQQLRELERGCDLLVATPGRLSDLLERGRIGLSCIRFLILDEADRMLDMGFEPQIRRIVEQEDMPIERQTFMFSATFPKEIQRLASDFLNNYVFLTVGRVGSAAADITQTVEYCDHQDKTPFLIRFLNTVESGLVLIFVETKRSADQLEYTLSIEGYPTTSIHGDRSQREREDALQSFRTGRTPIMVATDVAARGLDINNVMYVINYDMPSNIDDYVHRIGRTGRAGNKGVAISLMNERNTNIARELYDLLSENQQTVPDFLQSLSHARGGSRRGRNGGGNRFGGRDYRYQKDDRRGGGGGGGRNYGGGQNRGHQNNDRNYNGGGGSGYGGNNYRGNGYGGNTGGGGDDSW